ncbi:outer membrane protein assembly factor BamA [Piscirickettsia salmonis]|uniref:outer membrane protein assembly factor BamA n=1 Tax=Piscirickettsia salmonis TaxID=1238 RepID=UPI0012BAF68D|nr:outer membrane protein assembly factor BamA [Piscirickettsia salmonis]
MIKASQILMKKVIVSALLGVLGATAWAAPAGFVIKNIDIEGLQRLSKDLVLTNLPVKQGQTLTSRLSSEAIQNLYNSGYFNNVELKRDGQTLIVTVQERPVIGEIVTEGHHSIPKEALQQALTSTGLVQGHIYNGYLLKQIKQQLQDEEYNRGFYNARVTTKVTPLERNRVKVAIDISEGIPSVIGGINIVGNQVFSRSELLDQFKLSTPTLFSFITDNDKYTKPKLDTDIKSLTNFYMNQGFVEFRVNSETVSLSSDRKKVYINVNIHEGEKYHLSAYQFIGHSVLSQDQLDKIAKKHLKVNQFFSREDLLAVTSAVKAALGNKGYFFATVTPVPEVNKDNHTVSVNFVVDQKNLVYINQIKFIGNNSTNDKVLRRGSNLYEGGLMTTRGLNNSNQYLNTLGYFDSVKATTPLVPGKPGYVNVDYKVKENTRLNSVQFSIGYSQLDKLLLGLGYSTPNVLGTGNTLSANISWSRPSQSINVSFTDPYWTESGISRTLSVYGNKTNAEEQGLADYSTNSYGASMIFGIPATLRSKINLGMSVNHTTLNQGTNNSVTVQNFIDEQNGKKSYNDYRLILGWSYTNLDKWPFPTNGEKLSVTGTITGPGSDLLWYTGTVDGRWYHPINDTFTLSLRGRFGYGNSYGSGKGGLPFFNNFGAGGWSGSSTWGMIRGYDTLGPNDTIDCSDGSKGCEGNAIGGNLLLNAGASVYFPMPLVKDSSKMRLETFFDMGNVYDTTTPRDQGSNYLGDKSPKLSNLAYTLGLGLEWFSPLGAIDFSLASTLNTKVQGSRAAFQFSIGTAF